MPPELPPPREPVLREREVRRAEPRFAVVLRPLFFATPALLFLAAPPLFEPVLWLLFAAVLRVADFAAVLRAEPRFFAVDRLLVDDLGFADVERLAVDLLDLRADPLRLALPLLLPSIGHLPDITRSAASETASAINAPSRVALVITELAASLAVSAASIPAFLIALRAFGLALIAAAAAARPAASISLLIAALAILSTVESFDLDEREDFDELDDPLRLLDFAIANLPFGRPIDTRSEQQFRCGGERAPDFSQTGKLRGGSRLACGQAS